MNISLPEGLKSWAEARVAEGRYSSSSSDYIRDLILRDQDYAQKLKALQAAIDEGLASGFSVVDPIACIEELRAGLRGRAANADAA